MIALGLDLSLTGTGWAIVDTDRGTLAAETISTKPGRTEPRLQYIVDQLPCLADLACVEDIAHAAVGGSKSERGALYWMVRIKLWKLDVPVAPVNVSHVKMYATSRGNKVEKAEMISGLMRRLGMDRCPSFTDDNQVDAAWLAMMAADRLGAPLVDMPAGHRVALDRVTWPDLLSDDVPVVVS